jgi:chorismate synthase
MLRHVDEMKARGDTLGGVFEVVVFGLPPGLGSYVHWDRKLDGRLACAILSIQAVKAVEIGEGLTVCGVPGSRAHDEISYSKRRGFYRKTNRSGGIEGGMTTGEPLVVRGYMKPLSTLRAPLRSVDIVSKKAIRATVERSDVCAVPAAGVVGEAVVAWELAGAFLEKFGSDSIREIRRNYRAYLRQLAAF